MRIGVDTGGTFTDCVVFAGGRIKVLKVFSTPTDASRAIVQGVMQLAGEGINEAGSAKKIWQARLTEPKSSTLEVIHGTTVGTNTLLERNGARVALITTAGFEDVLEIGRQARSRLYDLNVQREPPLVPRALRLGVRGRVAADGQSLLPVSDAEIRRLLRWVRKSRAESLALCFLFAFANPDHERLVADALKKLGLPLSVSHEILPQFREYERMSTVVINAYLGPRMGSYLRNLERRTGLEIRRLGITSRDRKHARQLRRFTHGQIYVMQSNGGVSSAAQAARQPVRTILSGPAGGVVSAVRLAEQIGLNRAISFDMGGTSTDVCLLSGAPRTTHETSLAGLPVAVPVLDVHSVGAGGGFLARIDAGGALRVGPESAGATPGPICYARGGTGLTVTDANLILGRLDAEHFLGGQIRLDEAAATREFAKFLSNPGWRSGIAASFRSIAELAAGIVSVSNATMERALRMISVERGHDPRDFSLICYGGAGGLHATDLARSLGLPSVIVPPNPGAFSALGMLLSDVVRDASQSVLLRVPAAKDLPPPVLLSQLEKRYYRLERKARSELRREGFPAERARVSRRLDVCYLGQSYELSITFTPRWREDFHREHAKAYGYADPSRPLEIVSLHIRLLIATPRPSWLRVKRASKPHAQEALIKSKAVWFEGKQRSTQVYERQRLAPGIKLRGPAVIVEYSATTVVPPDFLCKIDEHHNLILSLC